MHRIWRRLWTRSVLPDILAEMTAKQSDEDVIRLDSVAKSICEPFMLNLSKNIASDNTRAVMLEVAHATTVQE